MLACDDLNRTPVIPGLAGGGNPESMPPPLGAAWIPGSPLTRRPGVTGERKTEGKDAHDDDDCNRRPPAGAVRPHLQSADNPYKIAGPRMDAGNVEHNGPQQIKGGKGPRPPNQNTTTTRDTGGLKLAKF